MNQALMAAVIVPQSLLPPWNFLTAPGDEGYCHLRRRFTLKWTKYVVPRVFPRILKLPSKVIFYKLILDLTNIR